MHSTQVSLTASVSDCLHSIFYLKCKLFLQVEYKEYTLRDYRKMKKEVKLGGLGPDLDSEDAKEKVGAFRI